MASFSLALLLVLTASLQGFAAADSQVSNEASIGQWTAPADIGIVGIHAALLHTGKVLMWYYPSQVGGNSPAVIFDPATQAVTPANIPSTADFFCSGLSFMSDGRLLVTGGLNGIPPAGDYGIPDVEIFDPITETWSSAQPMHNGRWYPTNIELPDGSTFSVSGDNAAGTNIVLPMESYNTAANTWTQLPATANIAPGTETYPRLVITPDGNMLMVGQTALTRRYNISTKTWTKLNPMNFGNRYYGGWVLLPGLQKILVAGGHDTTTGPATNTAELLDLTVDPPTWSYTGSMKNARYNAQLLILADGTVLSVGGNQVKKYNNPVPIPELYDPVSGTWKTMAKQQAKRGYHSTALLLPDGRVLSAGSDDISKPDRSHTVEIFSPPYLFKGARPTITGIPKTVHYGAQFAISTPNAASIANVALIRPAEVTHATDFDQRYVNMTFTAQAGKLIVTAPASGNYAPPGYYMVVIVNKNGVPSIMPFVQITN
jgi:hypothetical protein